MLRKIVISLFVLALCCDTYAQRIANRERIPKIKALHWLDDIVPAETEFTYIEFVHSRSTPCLESAIKIKRHIDNTDRPFRVIFITSERPDRIDTRLRECSGGYIGTLLDPSGHLFRDFAVRYIPFGVIIDSKRRAVWFGNPLTTDN